MTSLSILLCHLSLLAAAGASGSPPSATHSAAQLRTRLAAAQARISSFRVVYESHSYDASFPAGNYLHCEMAAKEPHFCSFLTAHGNDAINWADDPRHSRIYVSDHDWVMDMPVNRCFFSQKWDATSPLPGSLAGETFINATGWYPLGHRTRTGGGDGVTMLRYLERDESFCVVRPILDAVDGRWCHVLERPGKEVLWIDADRDDTLMAREGYGENGAVNYRYELTGHRKVAPQVWAPALIKSISYDHNADDADNRRRVVAEGLIAITEVAVNDVADNEFEWQPKPGALWMNHPQGPTQTHAGGLDHLDGLLRWIEKHASPPNARRTAVAWHALVASAVVLAFEGVIRIWQARRRKRPVSRSAAGERASQAASTIEPADAISS